MGEADLHPGSRALVAGYIYTRISRALRARSILLDLDLEATSVAGRNWVCTSNPDSSSRGWERRIGAHNAGRQCRLRIEAHNAGSELRLRIRSRFQAEN